MPLSKILESSRHDFKSSGAAANSLTVLITLGSGMVFGVLPRRTLLADLAHIKVETFRAFHRIDFMLIGFQVEIGINESLNADMGAEE
jgi:hypothetical protein